MKIEHQIDPRTLEYVDSKPYKERVKMLAALKLLDKEGLSPAILEMWGNKSQTELNIPVVYTKEEALKNGSKSEAFNSTLVIGLGKLRKRLRFRFHSKRNGSKDYRVETCVRTLTYRVCRKGWNKTSSFVTVSFRTP